MNVILTSLLSLVSGLVSTVGGTSTVGMVIDTLGEIIPLAIKEYQDIVPYIKNIIAAAKEDPTATQAQLDQLDALDKQADDAFDAAWAKVQAEDAAD